VVEILHEADVGSRGEGLLVAGDDDAADVVVGLEGVDTFVEIELWAKEKLDWLRGYLKLEHDIPSPDTPLQAIFLGKLKCE
jgi:hypothetical protein